MSRRCTCAGAAPGYPQHEPHCGKPETMTPLSLYACLTDQGVPREHVEAATTAVAVFLAEHLPAFIPYLDAQNAAMRVEALQLISGEA